MKKTRLLICDRDRSYLKALVGYFMNETNDYEITCLSELESYDGFQPGYDIKLLTKEFIDYENNELLGDGYEKDKSAPRDTAVRIQLMGADDDPVDDMNHLYKFQNMKSFLEKLEKYTIGCTRRRVKSNVKLVGIYSPSHFRMKVPFSFVYSRLCKQRGRVLMVDLEANSMLGRFVGRDGEYNLTDYLYAISRDGAESVKIGDYAEFYQGIAMLAPGGCPSEIWDIKDDQWLNFVDELKKSPFDVVVLILGDVSGEFEGLVSNLDDMILVEGNDEYSDACLAQFEGYMVRKHLKLAVQEVRLDENPNYTGRNLNLDKLMMESPGEWIRNVKRKDDQRMALGC